MEQGGVIIKVNEASPWVSSLLLLSQIANGQKEKLHNLH